MPDEYPPYPGPSTDDERGTDPWGWLYRDDPAARGAGGSEPSGQADTRGPETGQPDTGGQPGAEGEQDTAVHRPTFVAAAPTWHEQPADPYAGSATGAGDPAAAFVPDPQEPERRRKGGLLAAIVLGALALVAVLIVVVVVVFRSFGSPPATMPYTGGSAKSAPSSSASATSSGPSAQPTYSGTVAPIDATGASAQCVAPDAKDGAGHTVTYVPGNVTDQDPATAWRCDGDGVNQSITVHLPKNSSIARVGLINGYAKIDPKSHVQRYPEYRRITAVRWTFPNGATFDQHLSDGVQAVQTMNLPVQKGVDSVQLTVLSSTAPGQDVPSRNAVLISTVVVDRPA